MPPLQTILEEPPISIDPPFLNPQQLVDSEATDRSRPRERKRRRVAKRRDPRSFFKADLGKLQSVKKQEVERIIKAMSYPKVLRGAALEIKARRTRLWFINARRKKVKKVVRIHPNYTACSKKVFKINEVDPNAKCFARGLPEIFNVETLVELTNEDKTLASLIKAVKNNDF